MHPKQKRPPSSVLLPRFRLLRAGEIALGPGKVDLLRHIAETHSITEAASRMDMSYMRAWILIKTMNRNFRKPLVVARRGGAKKGGAELTPTGQQVMTLYNHLDEEARVATARTRRCLLGLLKQ